MRVRQTNHIRIVILALALCATSTARAQDREQKALPNFYRVNDFLYRGGQPTEDGLKKLNELGIKTVINLRDDDERAHAEETAVRTAGLRYFNLPLPTFDKPSDERVAEVLAVINRPENQPVFVHCKRGADRTGVIVAIFRIEHEAWTADQAKEEAKHFGLGFWQVRMKDYIGDYYRRKQPRQDKSVVHQRKRNED